MNLNMLEWIKKQKSIQKIRINKVNISKLNGWKYNKNQLFHKSNKFFKIVGIDIKSNYFKKNWDQPIIIQNEVGILGIIKDIKRNKYLLQAKLEPGNINKLQLSPTVQATKSNYSKVHGGKKVPYINFFLKKQKNKLLQSEQAFRYYNKYNSNIIYIINKKIKITKEFRWFSLNEIYYLLKRKNTINMDTLSVFSSFIKKNIKDIPLNKSNLVSKWIKKNDKKYYLKSILKNLSELKDWNVNKKEISHKKKRFFSIIGINVSTNNREVKKWSQPILQGKKLALAGFLIKEYNNTKHYLCKYILKPGSKFSTISCTVNTSDLSRYNKNNTLTTFQKKIIKKYLLNNKYKTLYRNILSDEGGRFFHNQIQYIGKKIEKNDKIKIPKTYCWISHNQMINLINKKKLDIEARLLFGIINIKNTI